VVEALLAAGASTEPVAADTNRDGSTPLMQVAMDRAESPKYIVDPERIPNPVALASLLLKHGAKLEATDADGRTALFHAIEANNVDVAAFLIDAGADPNKTWGVRETGAKATDARYVGYTPLMFALTDYWSTRDPSMIRLLLERGADPNFMADKEDFDSEDPRFAGVTVLGAAALSGSMTVVRDLLEHGADPNLPRADGALPADIAREAGFPKIAALIAQAAKKKAP
jgi:ankyrin repeat protein